MAKKHYVSNSTESTRMFKSNFLESLTKVHYCVPLIVYIPVMLYLSWQALRVNAMDVWTFIALFLAGLAVWTISEYLLHRFVFHFKPSGKFLERVHFIFHGVHHDYPRDRLRLVMPPSASVPMAVLIYFIFRIFLSSTVMNAFFTGFLLGYLLYDMIHYAIHHANFKSAIWKRIRQHHMLHHYDDPKKGFGVSSSFWDDIFGTSVKKNTRSAD